MFLSDWIVNSLGDVLIGEDAVMVGTGTGDRAVSTIGKDLMGDGNYLKPFGTEGSYIAIANLSNGVYEFEVNQLGKIDSNNDALYAWNGKNLILIADNENGLITNSIDVIYNELAFISLDVGTTTGTTDFTITNLLRSGDLSYSAPVRINLTPDSFIGDVDLYEKQTRIGSGTDDRAVSTLSTELGIDLSSYGIEGSYGSWFLENGVYEISYSLYTSEDDLDRDNIYFYDGAKLNLFDQRSNATIQSSSTRFISESKTQTVEVTNNELTFITLDTIDKSGTLQLRLNGIERLGDIPETVITEVSGNESIETAYNLEMGEIANKIPTQFKSDYYAIALDEPVMIEVKSSENVDIFVLDETGNFLDIGAYRDKGENGNDNLFFNQTGNYYLELYGFSNTTDYNLSYTPYSVEDIDIINAGETKSVDTFEGNNYFKFSVPNGDIVDITASFVNSLGDIDIELFELSNYEYIDGSYSVDDDELINANLQAGDYLINFINYTTPNPNATLSLTSTFY